MKSPRVDIVLLNWNSLADTSACIDSIRNLYYPHVKTWVIDNGSANKEAIVLEQKFPEVKVIALPENIGFCGGCNEGMKRALEEGSDYIMLLNNDALLTPGIVEELINNYQQLKNPGAISPAILYYPETGKAWFTIAKWETRWKRGEAMFRLSYDENYNDIKNKQPYESEFACGCCLFISSDVVRKVGLFDERYFAFYDEAEWCARMRRMGFISYVIPSSYIYHKVGGSTPNLVMTYLMSRNRLLWVKDNLSFSKKKQAMPKQYSRALIRGWKDYFAGRFGKWNAATEKIIFNRS